MLTKINELKRMSHSDAYGHLLNYTPAQRRVIHQVITGNNSNLIPTVPQILNALKSADMRVVRRAYWEKELHTAKQDVRTLEGVDREDMLRYISEIKEELSKTL